MELYNKFIINKRTNKNVRENRSHFENDRHLENFENTELLLKAIFLGVHMGWRLL
jgi:hypothetical protein